MIGMADGLDRFHDRRLPQPTADDNEATTVASYSRSESLSAAQRGRGWGPLRSNGRVRWCFAKPDASLADAAAHLSIGRYFGMGGKSFTLSMVRTYSRPSSPRI